MGVAAAWAGQPIDLDSPFSKTVIFKNRLSQIEEFEVRRGKSVGENLELIKLDESLLIVPKATVQAVLPKLPAEGAAFTQEDAKKAYSLLQAAEPDWPNRPETSARALAAWRELATRPSSHEQGVASQKAEKAQAWLEKIQPEEGKPKPVDLGAYLKEGEALMDQGGPKTEEIQKQIEKVKNLMAMDFGEIRGKRLPTEWNELSPLPAIGLTAVLLVLGFWVLGNVGNFSSALKAGVIRSSSKGGESRTSFNLKGVVYLVYAGAGAAILTFLLQKAPFPSPPEVSESAAGVAERAVYLSMNTQNRWSSQSKSVLEVEAPALFAALQKLLPEGEFRLSQVLAYFGPQMAWSEGLVFWRQTIHLAFVPIYLDFRMVPSPEPWVLEHPAMEGSQVGKIPLGGFLGQLIWGRWQGVTSEWDRALGLQSGAVWSWTEGGRIRVETPAVTSRREEKKQTELAGEGKPVFKESLSATELAEVFADGHGDVYVNRTISVRGNLKSVSSTRRLGNTLASEVTRSTLAKAGGPEAVNAVAPSGQEDFPDAFFLETGDANLESKIEIKVLVKCPHTYSLDNRGDLYRSGTSPNLDTPVVARQKQALFKGGRVEGMERNVIEIYGAQPPEEAP
jgi:hypothetical protein